MNAMDRGTEVALVLAAQYSGEDKGLLGKAQDAKAALIEQHKAGIWKIVRKTRARGETQDDLFQWGVYFFLFSLEKFDATLGTRLTTWTYVYVKLRLRNQAWRSGIIHLPPNASTTCKAAVDLALGEISGITSKNRDAIDEQLAFEDQPPEFEYDERELLEWGLARLDDRARRILLMRANGRTLASCGAQFCITKERVRQIELDAYDELRRAVKMRSGRLKTIAKLRAKRVRRAG